MTILDESVSTFFPTDILHSSNKLFTPQQIKCIEVNKLNAKKNLERQKQIEGISSEGVRNQNEFSFSKMLENYIEYDLTKIKDYKGGYIVEEKSSNEAQNSKFNHAIRHNIIFDPPISLDPSENIKCDECGSVELDFQLLRVFNARVCFKCKKALPDKYSLLTKTECKNDYLLTDSELRDIEILPHMKKTNPRKPEWGPMMLFLRYQIEEFAWKKWGGPEKLDIEWERRVKEKKMKKALKLQKKIEDLRKRTRTSQYIEKIKGKQEKHIHNFSLPVTNSMGLTIKKCSCGFEIEEIFM
ncbi:unnamed protein product [Pneumocystis jirovecii]|uniref:XPA C-terminal domain-containing protein n=2 Tax=Pneumocystis jirovecii TaxID=42068 RepID=L0P8Q1_PNEJI|nr:DNA repair protein [Pneumocystis jirovecii RU7]KTW30566.1 DNA repair protein [Pneumocystis jirovecii RU7]CCJ28597.1 unnamed protein product [Pneumocystis jirovecii]